MQENRLNKFSAIFSEVSSSVGRYMEKKSLKEQKIFSYMLFYYWSLLTKSCIHCLTSEYEEINNKSSRFMKIFPRLWRQIQIFLNIYKMKYTFCSFSQYNWLYFTKNPNFLSWVVLGGVKFCLHFLNFLSHSKWAQLLINFLLNYKIWRSSLLLPWLSRWIYECKGPGTWYIQDTARWSSPGEYMQLSSFHFLPNIQIFLSMESVIFQTLSIWCDIIYSLINRRSTRSDTKRYRD